LPSPDSYLLTPPPGKSPCDVALSSLLIYLFKLIATVLHSERVVITSLSCTFVFPSLFNQVVVLLLISSETPCFTLFPITNQTGLTIWWSNCVLVCLSASTVLRPPPRNWGYSYPAEPGTDFFLDSVWTWTSHRSKSTQQAASTGTD